MVNGKVKKRPLASNMHAAFVVFFKGYIKIVTFRGTV